MDTGYRFYDYIDADGNGANVIGTWLNSTGKDSKAYFSVMIPYLEKSPPPGMQGSFWDGKHAKLLKSKKGENWDGFVEIKKRGTVQYRLIAKVVGRDVFLVACGIHKGNNWNTDVSRDTAVKRLGQMIDSPTKYRRDHED